ncbi:MAG: hypothetical protein IT361_12055 [Gemmatimonadaceae bacterium]|nr:hypothetical protein [Gemmatimonadaceae bacterium]
MAIRKLGATIYLLWLALYLGAPQPMHHCPEHSPVVAATASAPTGHAHHGGGDTPEPEQHKCCCPGPQCGTTALVVVDAPRFSAEVPAHDGSRPPAREQRPVPLRGPHVLPFATAPPASTRLT